MDYAWLKAAHVAAVLIFTGGLIVQAIGVAAGDCGEVETVRLVERWDQRVTVPAMLLVWLSGAIVAATGAWFGSHWLWGKLVIVMMLSGLHGIQSGRLRRLRRTSGRETGGNPFRTSALVAVSVVAIALLAVAKPF